MQSPRVPVIALALFLISSTAMAQLQWPPGANSGTSEAQLTPFSSGAIRQAGRALIFLDAWTLTSLLNQDITHVSLNARSTTTINKTGHLRIRVGQVRSLRSARFEQNLVGPLGYHYRKQVSISGNGASNRFALDLPFRYTGGDLGIDIYFTSTDSRPFEIEAVAFPHGASGSFSMVGPGGKSRSGAEILAYVEPWGARPGGIINLRAEGFEIAAPSGLALLAIGPPLGPVSFSGASGPHWMYLNPLSILPTTESVSGSSAKSPGGTSPYAGFIRSSLSLPIPNNPAFNGASAVFQWFRLESTQPDTIKLSDAVRIRMGSADPNAGAHVGQTLWTHDSDGLGAEGGTLSPPGTVPLLVIN